MRTLLWKHVDRDLALAFAAGAALLLASLANFISYNDYPYFRIDVGIVVLSVLATALVMAFFYRPQRQWGRSFLEGLLAALFVDLNTDSWWLVAAAGFGVAAITAWRRTSLLGPMAVLGSVVFLTTLGGVGGRSSWIATTKGKSPGGPATAAGKPAIIHLILDEHLGLEGLAAEDARGVRLRDELRHFYVASGFAVYGGAYSQHYHSANSIPYILNYGGGLAQSLRKSGVHSGPTRHLQSLVRQGYKLTIFQSDYADFCADAAFDECITYDSSSLRPTLAVPMTSEERAELIGAKFLKLSDAIMLGLEFWAIDAALARKLGFNLPSYNTRSGNSSAVGTLEAARGLIARLKSLQPGEAIFAHLLLPHHPYVTRRDCSYLPWGPWEGLRTSAPSIVKRAEYDDQIRCTTRLISAMLEAISKSPAGQNAIMIIHGDHGSRMSRIGPDDQTRGTYRDEDMVEVFSTLFAIRAPGMQPAYFDERRPVARLLGDFAASGFRTAPHPPQPSAYSVYLTNVDWKPVKEVSLPDSWTKGFDRPAAAH